MVDIARMLGVKLGCTLSVGLPANTEMYTIIWNFRADTFVENRKEGAIAAKRSLNTRLFGYVKIKEVLHLRIGEVEVENVIYVPTALNARENKGLLETAAATAAPRGKAIKALVMAFTPFVFLFSIATAVKGS